MFKVRRKNRGVAALADKAKRHLVSGHLVSGHFDNSANVLGTINLEYRPLRYTVSWLFLLIR
jgi:riboflavin synthase alpha subunit